MTPTHPSPPADETRQAIAKRIRITYVLLAVACALMIASQAIANASTIEPAAAAFCHRLFWLGIGAALVLMGSLVIDRGRLDGEARS